MQADRKMVRNILRQFDLNIRLDRLDLSDIYIYFHAKPKCDDDHLALKSILIC